MTKTFDLEERTYNFASYVGRFCKKLPKTISGIEYQKQLFRSSSSIGANYIEANEALSKKDFLLRLRISRKEAKETAYWLRLITSVETLDDTTESAGLLREAIELKKILSAIIEKSK